MEWKHKKVIKLSGLTFSSNLREVIMAVNKNADVLKESVQKIEELNERINILEKENKELKNIIENGI